MIRVLDLDSALNFFCSQLGLVEVRRKESTAGRFTLIFLQTDEGGAEIELTHNWDEKNSYSCGRNFGHLAFNVDNIYQYCKELEEKGVKILRPPRDGYMAFVRSPDQISVEILQKGEPLQPEEPWLSMENSGEW